MISLHKQKMKSQNQQVKRLNNFTGGSKKKTKQKRKRSERLKKQKVKAKEFKARR